MPDRDYPQAIAPDHVEPVPRRVRAVAGGRVVVDTTRAIYVWEWPAFPQYYVPLGDIDGDALVDEQRDEQTPRGPARGFGLRSGDAVRPNAVLGVRRRRARRPRRDDPFRLDGHGRVV